jgi:hypothetical protein
MQKLINNAVTIFLGLVIGTFFFFAVQAKAEPPNFDQTGYRDPLPRQQQRVQEKSNVNTALDDVINLILKQGFAGAIIVCLGFWTFRTDKLNRAMQKENFDKLAVISQDCSGHMASVSARLENLEREVEASKTLALMKRS